MFERARPARLAGFVGFIGLLVAASLGDRETLLLAFVACIPLVFFVAVNQAGGGGAPAISVTLLGLAGSALALAHAVLLRDLPHGGGLVFAVLLGTFVGDTGAYLGGRAFGRRPLAPTICPNKTVEGLAIGVVIADRGGLVGGAQPGVARRHQGRDPGHRRSRWPRRSATSSSPI